MLAPARPQHSIRPHMSRLLRDALAKPSPRRSAIGRRHFSSGAAGCAEADDGSSCAEADDKIAPATVMSLRNLFLTWPTKLGTGHLKVHQDGCVRGACCNSWLPRRADPQARRRSNSSGRGAKGKARRAAPSERCRHLQRSLCLVGQRASMASSRECMPARWQFLQFVNCF